VSFLVTSLLIGSFLAALLLIEILLHVAGRFGLVAEPNERSFHEVPKPAIGGIAIVVPAMVYLGATVGNEQAAPTGLLLGGAALATIGLLDDLRELSAGLRFAVQLMAVAVLLWFMTPDMSVPVLLAIGFLLLWQVNLFNFMDGIDGIAGVQTLVFCVGVHFLGAGLMGWTGQLLWVVTGATLGFLAYNWPPAKIFMGDVGSLFLGLLIGGLAIEMARAQTIPIAASVILLTGFWFDASYTLCVRMLTGQRVTQAHRSHLYQKLAGQVGHLKTTAMFFGYGLVWLLPLAWLAMLFRTWALVWIGLAVLPLLVAAVVFKAGTTRPAMAD